ncbi:unnamed protein product [Coffea canephora]|uniref:DH200=94 genomic scaffold, scaffold_545 n=1 Tax=Coffea canephora TaxID=49390 RepID=A0A068VIP6_COFCA|nr:unnamed protein product [Coffea canephora]
MQRIAFARKSGDLCKKVERIGLKIAEKCKGLPLAAKTMGSLLRFKDTVQQWQNVLDSEIWQLKEADVSLFPHLYLSDNELPPELKRCFSYCAVFPKDFEINVEKLIRLWIAQGYVRPNRRGERLELVGLEYFNNLAMRSFFQELQECKMHDIVHDFAQFLTKNECHVLHGIDYEQGTGRNLSTKRARHLTWLGTERAFSSLVVDFGRLRSFFAFSHGRVAPQGSARHLFCSLNCVRTLTLSCCGLHEVPAEIGSLNHLRHLDLSWNLFETLPEAICDLYYLETFEISNCGDLSCLPQRIEGLVHLRHLFNLINYEVHQIPQGLGKLTSLCTLTQFNARSNSDDLAILKYLNQLERLRIDIYGEVDFGRAELGKKIYLHEMYLWFNPGVHFMETPSCIESMELPPNLQQLALDMYPRNQLPSWLVTKSLVNNLTKLIINGPHNVSSLTDLWKLSSLEELRLIRVEKLECLGKEFFGITIALHENTAFPNLRKLHFQCCPNWTNWEDLSEDDEKVDVSIMPHLEELHIEYCKKFETLPHRILGKISFFKSLKVLGCNKLRDCYSDKIGDDSMKISHISQVDIS